MLGQDPFGEELDKAAREVMVQNRPLVVRRLAENEALPVCHILFISNSARAQLPRILAAVRDASTLTVGEVEEFTRLGGCLRFFLVENRVNFEINLEATRRARLKVSAKLLQLAQISGGRPPR